MSKTIKLGINGFGRIGRLITRISQDFDNIEVVGINDPFLTPDYAKYSLESSSEPLAISEYELAKLYPANFKSTMPTIEELEEGIK